MEYTVKEFAARWQVTERTVHNWIAKSAVEVTRTPGGCIRIIQAQRSQAVFVEMGTSEKPNQAATPWAQVAGK